MIVSEEIVIHKDSHKVLEYEVADLDDLLGCQVVWKLAKRVKGEPVITKTSDDPDEIEIEDNKFIIYITPSDNRNMANGTYYCEARVTDIDGNSRPVASGVVSVVPTLTSAP